MWAQRFLVSVVRYRKSEGWWKDLAFFREQDRIISEEWMPRQHNSQSLVQRAAERTVLPSDNANNALDWNPPTMSKDCVTPITIYQQQRSDEDQQYAVKMSRYKRQKIFHILP